MNGEDGKATQEIQPCLLAFLSSHGLIHNFANEALVLHMIAGSLDFEIADAFRTERKGNLGVSETLGKFFGRWEKIRHDLELAHWFICIGYFLLHIIVCL